MHKLMAAQKQVGPGAVWFFFCPNFLCLIPQIQPIMLGLCPIMPNYAQLCRLISKSNAGIFRLALEAGADRRAARRVRQGLPLVPLTVCSWCTGAPVHTRLRLPGVPIVPLSAQIEAPPWEDIS